MVKRKRPKMERLTKEQFLLEVKQAPAWALIINEDLVEIELIVQHEGQIPVSYLGPDPIETNTVAYDKFISDLELITGNDSNHTFGA